MLSLTRLPIGWMPALCLAFCLVGWPVAQSQTPPTADQPASESPATDQPASESPATDQPASESPATDQPASEAGQASSAPNQDGGAEAAQESLTAEELAKVRQWIEELGSSEFATRERAAGQLMEMGTVVISELHRAAQATADAEMRLRAEQIIKQLSDGDLQARIGEFLAGRNVNFDGWQVTQRFLGDSLPVRELFVDMMKEHPDFLKSLEGTTRDRAIALEGLLTRVQGKLRTIRDEPVPADVFALLLVALDPDVPLTILYESVLLNLTNKHVTTAIERNAALSGQYLALLDRWIVRSSLTSREDVLLLGMDRDLPSTLPLALQTLQEATQPETLATAMQAMAKSGNLGQIEPLKRFLDDARPVSDRGFLEDESRTQIRDLAMIAIAMIKKVPLSEIGMPHVETHLARGFLPSDFAYPSEPERSREKTLERINQLIRESSDREGS